MTKHWKISGIIWSKRRCPACQSSDVIGKGRSFGNRGKKQYKCGSCGHFWQYGGDKKSDITKDNTPLKRN